MKSPNFHALEPANKVFYFLFYFYFQLKQKKKNKRKFGKFGKFCFYVILKIYRNLVVWKKMKTKKVESERVREKKKSKMER